MSRSTTLRQLVTDRITEVRADHIVSADGTERPVDTIIFGTGFDVSGNLTRVKVFGRGAAELNEQWKERGIGAHKGITVAGFPNFFMLLGPNTGLGHTSVVFMIERQIAYVLRALDLLDRRSGRFIDVRPEAQHASVDRVQNRLVGSVWQSGCRSWYLDDGGRNITIWPHFTWKYWMETRRVDPRDYQVVGVRGS
jgi:cation diffusion facilitator CzcD-associated flavoprotein CzcO